MTLRKVGRSLLVSDKTPHFARKVSPLRWELSFLPEGYADRGKRLTIDQAGAGLRIAEMVEIFGSGLFEEVHAGCWPWLDQYATELGITGLDAVIRCQQAGEDLEQVAP